jgi:hypothetical protein
LDLHLALHLPTLCCCLALVMVLMVVVVNARSTERRSDRHNTLAVQAPNTLRQLDSQIRLWS